MTHATLAPYLRGALIAQTGRPWIVRAVKHDAGEPAQSGSSQDTCTVRIPVSITCGSTAGGEDAEKSCRLSADSEKDFLQLLRAALGSHDGIPVRMIIECCGESYRFVTAPDCDGAEAVLGGNRKEAWGSSYTGAFTSRSDVVKNRVAVVTGGAQGFGEEIVRGLVGAGAIVCIADLNREGAEKLAHTLNAQEKRLCAFAVQVNVGEEESVKNLFETISATTGGLDLCVSNAGILRASSILDQDIAAFKLVTDVNYTAFAIVTKHCGQLMKKQYAAAQDWYTDIIQINSKSGLEGSNKNGSYAGGKFGGIGLVQSFALELVAYNIKVNAVCPGNFYDGPLWSDPVKGLFVQYLNTGKVPGAKTVADVKTFYEAKSPIHRGCTGPDVLKAVFYIVEQIYETGQAVPVTGGQVMLH